MGGWGGRWVSDRKKKKKICIHLLFVLMLHIKFQVPSSSSSLVLTNGQVDLENISH